MTSSDSDKENEDPIEKPKRPRTQNKLKHSKKLVRK